MANPAEVARIAADEKREARIVEVAQQLRDAAQVQFDKLVAAHTTLISEFPAKLQEIEQRSATAYNTRTQLLAAETSTEDAIAVARAACDAIDEERRAATMTHLEDTERSRQTIAARMGELVLEHWLEQATQTVAKESTT